VERIEVSIVSIFTKKPTPEKGRGRFQSLWTDSVKAAISILFLVLPMGSVQADELPEARKDGTLQFRGKILEAENVSGIDHRGKFLVIGADEGAKIQVLERVDKGVYQAHLSREISLKLKKKKFKLKNREVDIEGIAWGNEYVYVVGSHSRARKRVKPKEGKAPKWKLGKALKQLQKTKIEPSRERLYRLKLDDEGKLVPDSIELVSLRNLFVNDPLLRPFQAIPSKENGIDIEGLAVSDKDELYVGFRGPILRGNFVPVLVVKIETDDGTPEINDMELLFVDLDGRGIRGMTEVRDGFLILGGPMGDGPGTYQVVFWDGEQAVPSKETPDAKERHLEPLCTIPTPDGAKAEGIALWKEEGDTTYQFVIVYDGVLNGGATVFTCSR
jgi:hypothetical protein